MMSEKQGIELDLPLLSPSQAVMLTDWLFAFAHELERYYADEIRSQQQADVYQRKTFH